MPNERSFERLTSPEELAAVGPEWDALVEQLPRPTPFLLQGWLQAWWRHYGAGWELDVHVALRDGRLVGALPLQRRRRRGLARAEWIGGVHAQLADALRAPDADPGLARSLAARAAADVDLLDLSGLPAGTPLAPPLQLVERVEAPVADLSGGWDALYRDRLSSQRRKLHRKRLRQLEESGRVEVRVATEPSELEAALEEALRLHALRWQGRPDDSTYGLPGGAAFHRDALQELAPRARIGLLEVDGRAIAFDYSFRVGDSLVGNGIGFDPAYSRYSPGWLLMLGLLERAAADGIRRFEMLGGDESYKLQVADPQPLHQGLAGRSPAGRAAAAARLGAVLLRRRAKQSESLRRIYERARRRSTAET